MKIKYTLSALALGGLLAAATPALADYATGIAAYDAGNYQQALVAFEVDANNGHARAQERLGNMYRTGQGMSRPDPVLAIKWLTLAYTNGLRSTLPTLETLREGISEQQLVAGEQMALSWLEDANRIVFADDDTDALYDAQGF
jgi:TPR repeat protein